MSFHFAAARTPASSHVARVLVRKAPCVAANDNVGPNGTTRLDQQDLLLKAALRHFAQHGISAAHEARKHAERAFFSGDRPSYDWWLGICRTLDRRTAEAVVCRERSEG